MQAKIKKIGIVDDAPFIREILRTIANSQGWYIVGEAENGDEAVKMAETCGPDLIIMDLVMPLKNGIDATTQILKINPRIKIIACSTLDQEENLMRAIEAGCCSYITKPFSKDALINSVEQAFTLSREAV